MIKNKPSVRALGLIFVIIASAGLLFSFSGILSTWFMRPRILNSLDEFVNTFDSILNTTDQSLLILDSTIENSQNNLNTIYSTLNNLDGSIESISESLQLSSSLIGDDLRLTIIETQIALSSASSSAKLIDDTLSIIAAIPLLGARYQPDVPLNISLANVAGSMSDIPVALETIELSLDKTSGGITNLKDDLLDLGEDILYLSGNLTDAQENISEYQKTIEQLQIQTNQVRTQSRGIALFISVIFSGLFFWLGVAQVNILLQGLIFLRGEQYAVNLADIRRD
jgi:peptidoglycan hydrolase CwlO-like protein